VSRRTIARAVELSGIGLHSGAAATVRLEPAALGKGIVFERRDLGPGRPIRASLDQVAATERRTALRNGAHRADTVEHLLATLYALEIDDLVVALSGPEIPIFDGSFAPFVGLVDRAGRQERAGTVRRAALSSTLRVTEGDSLYRVEPAKGLELRVTLEYAEPVIGRQGVVYQVSPETFRKELQAARTFGFLREVEELRTRGLLGGATPDCAIVLDDVSVVNTTLRWPDEFARHKAGDLVGDLALVGARLSLRVDAFRPSHRGNIACAQAIARAARFSEEG
jgi:UDP-3-O-acyl N-acetylglucosamine deacetylase